MTTMSGDYVRRAGAEFLGTFAVVFVAAGTAVYASSLTDVGLGYGLVVAAMVASFGIVSGGHFNPAVTLAFVVARRISVALAVVYWLAQFVAAIAAAALLDWVLPALADERNIGAPGISEQVTTGQAVVVEALVTAFVVLVYFAAASRVRDAFSAVGGIAVGLTVSAGVLVSFALTGAALNPARALGPQLIGSHWADAWVWYLGPFAGAAIAGVLYELIFMRPARPAAEPAAPAPPTPPAADTPLV